jgi:DNA-binding response OmpR family regulator
MQHAPLNGCSLLIVEDEPLIAMDIELTLEQAGARLTVATAVDQALLLVEQDGLSGAIVDHTLGPANSACLYKRLRERAIPFIVYTGRGLTQQECDGGILLPKPVPPERLLTAVEQMLGHSH